MRLAGCDYDQIIAVVGGKRGTAKVLFYHWKHRALTNKRKTEWQRKHRPQVTQYKRNYFEVNPERKAYRNYYAKCYRAQVKPLTFEQWFTPEIEAKYAA